ncbi:TIGR04372 family glycosyltransferase [Burkholderiaceae bacterium]|nr:TIGR04372 family glycosyltransferase [Burkholderiaceae bacterium]
MKDKSNNKKMIFEKYLKMLSMTKLRSLILRFIKGVFSLSKGLWRAILACGTLLSVVRALSKAKVFVMLEAGGFGHTITTVDLARRMFPTEDITFLMFCGKGRYNKYTTCIWTKNINIYFCELEWTKLWYTALPVIAKLICSPFLNKNSIVFWNLAELHNEARRFSPSSSTLIPRNLNCDWVTGYFRIIDSSENLPKPCMPKGLVEQVEQALELTGREKIASFYLRNKGGDITSHTRSGSALSDYLDACSLLLENGYTICITGDIEDAETAHHMYGKVLTKSDALSKGVDAYLFQLYAVFKANICITDSGGGAWLPMVLSKPQLCINAFPFWYAMRGAWVYPKRVLTASAKRLTSSDLFTKLLYMHDVGQGNTLESNSSTDISDAVREFVGRIELADTAVKEYQFAGLRPGWYESSEARILTTWFSQGDLEDPFWVSN